MLGYVPYDIVFLVLLLAVLWLTLRPGVRRSEREAAVRHEAQLDALRLELERLGREQSEQRASALIEAGRLREQLTERFAELRAAVSGQLGDSRTELVRAFGDLRVDLGAHLAEQRERSEVRQAEALRTLTDALQQGTQATRVEVANALARTTEELGQRFAALTQNSDQRLQEIGGLVEKRLGEGFEKTTQTFADVLQRLALIDEAQKRITELSANVMSLQEVLADKRSRGAFGEVQLAALVRNIVPEPGFELQYHLPNGRIADCMLFLPEPTGRIVIDAKFPLESFRRLSDPDVPELERKAAEKQFKVDVRRHVSDIAERYILPGVTADGAVMFVPAEAVFAEIQAHHQDLVEAAHQQRVWIVSPTTLWAVLNTARAVLKDAATRRHVHVIQEQLSQLAKDFMRFRERMEALAKHIRQAHEDVDQVHTSAQKITAHFERIERVEIEPAPALVVSDNAERD